MASLVHSGFLKTEDTIKEHVYFFIKLPAVDCLFGFLKEEDMQLP